MLNFIRLYEIKYVRHFYTLNKKLNLAYERSLVNIEYYDDLLFISALVKIDLYECETSAVSTCFNIFRIQGYGMGNTRINHPHRSGDPDFSI